jgi:signal transduction histidine kinase
VADADARILAISVDPPEVSERFRRKLGAEFTFLSDENGELLDELNIRHCCGWRGKDIAFPTGILVDKHGLVRWVYEAEFGHMRMTPQDLFDAMERLALEEQNRELRRGRAVSKVVRQVFLMKRPDDLGRAIDVMQDELRGLGVKFSVCGVAVVDNNGGKVRTFSARGEGVLETRDLSVRDVPEVQKLIDAWEERRVRMLHFEDTELGSASDRPEWPKWKWMVTVPFSHGAVFAGSDDAQEPSADQVATLTEFADSMSVAYQRFADFHELQDAQLQLIQSEKMASLGQLVAGVAHELNTPMGAIQSNTQTERATFDRIRDLLALGDVDGVSKTLGVLQAMNGVNDAATRRMTQIVSNLRKFAHLDESEWKTSDVREGIDETLALVEHQIRGRVTVEKDYGEVPPVNCYAGQLNQVFMNLIVNAIQAIDGEGRIRIETRRAGDEIIVRIEDSGSGIPEAELPRVFDPGFTTKGVGVGTGLGLSICYRIVQNHGGRLTVDSELGRGSVFTMSIPLNTVPPGDRPAPSAYTRLLSVSGSR